MLKGVHMGGQGVSAPLLTCKELRAIKLLKSQTEE